MLVAGLLVAVAGSVAGFAGLVVSAGLQYRLQSQQVELIHGIRATAATGADADHGARGANDCSAVCQTQKGEVLSLHVRGVPKAGEMLLLTNLLLVGWVIALRGGEVETARVAGDPAR